ncbi:MAG: GGDEF domain-containing protein [Pseudomonas aeruginosa]|nr:GGDEF domain-containing protein [Pseudomonas aeruginosa]
MAEAQRLSEIDPLTELYNRRKFEQCLHHEWMRRQRHGRATALVMIDVDHFKRINDLFGHSTGDRVLVAFGRLVASELREVDVLARWGGEEFILLLPETGLEAAAALAERLRQRVRSQSFEMGERLTASFGVGVLNDGETLDLLYRFATPLRIDGSLVNAVRVRGDSGVLVMAYAEGDLEDFARRQGATPHPAERAALDGFGELEVLYSRPLPPRPGLDESPPRLVIGRGIEAAAQAFRWGCRSYDG